MSELRDQLSAIWQRPGVENPGNINIWTLQGDPQAPAARPGAKRKPEWDKALLKRAKRDLPNWFASRNKPY
jgi:hypothetical protein